MVYGMRQHGQSETYQRVSNAQDVFLLNNTPGMWPVDGYPQLRHLPRMLQWWRPYGEKVYRMTRDAFKGYYDLMMENRRNGTERESFAKRFFEEAEEKYPHYDFDQRLFVGGGMIEAGNISRPWHT